MSYAILKFKIPEEQEDFELALKGSDHLRAIQDFDQYLRNIVKNGDEKLQTLNATEVRDQFHEFLRDYGITW